MRVSARERIMASTVSARRSRDSSVTLQTWGAKVVIIFHFRSLRVYSGTTVRREIWNRRISQDNDNNSELVRKAWCPNWWLCTCSHWVLRESRRFGNVDRAVALFLIIDLHKLTMNWDQFAHLFTALFDNLREWWNYSSCVSRGTSWRIHALQPLLTVRCSIC